MTDDDYTLRHISEVKKKHFPSLFTTYSRTGLPPCFHMMSCNGIPVVLIYIEHVTKASKYTENCWVHSRRGESPFRLFIVSPGLSLFLFQEVQN